MKKRCSKKKAALSRLFLTALPVLMQKGGDVRV